jgi:hypothetical protein
MTEEQSNFDDVISMLDSMSVYPVVRLPLSDASDSLPLAGETKVGNAFKWIQDNSLQGSFTLSPSLPQFVRRMKKHLKSEDITSEDLSRYPVVVPDTSFIPGAAIRKRVTDDLWNNLAMPSELSIALSPRGWQHFGVLAERMMIAGHEDVLHRRDLKTTDRATTFWDESVLFVFVACSMLLREVDDDLEKVRKQGENSQCLGDFIRQNSEGIRKQMGGLRSSICEQLENLLYLFVNGGSVSWHSGMSHQAKEAFLSVTAWDLYLMCKRLSSDTILYKSFTRNSSHTDNKDFEYMKEEHHQDILDRINEVRGERTGLKKYQNLITSAVLKASGEFGDPGHISTAEVLCDALGSGLMLSETVPLEAFGRMMEHLDRIADKLTPVEVMSVLYIAAHPTYVFRTCTPQKAVEVISFGLESDCAVQFVQALVNVLMDYDSVLPTFGNWKTAVRDGGDVFSLNINMMVPIMSKIPNSNERVITREHVIFRSKYNPLKMTQVLG